ncbi:MAG: hypothetical protein HFH24_05510 [Ruminococcus sp.]|nr:hypothetical protein [Ruminococcus sp.]
MILAFAFSSMGYLSNDDAGIQNLLAGNITGTPYITHQFINVILGFFVSSFYRMFPGIQWWYVYSQLLLLLGTFFIHLSVFKICRDKNRKLVTAFLTAGIADIGFLVYAFANVAFTVVPAVFGTGLVAILIMLEDVRSKKWVRVFWIIVSVGYILVLIHRRDSGLVLLCYILLGVLYYYSKDLRSDVSFIRKNILVYGSFILASVAVIAFNSMISERINGKDFMEFNRARGSYMDYQKDSYYENPELYHEAGWNENIYILVNSWCFIDDTITTENFKYIAEKSEVQNDFMRKLKNSVKSTITDERCQALLLLWAGSVFLNMFHIWFKRDNRSLIFLLLNNIGSIVLMSYLVIKGRAIYRALFVIIFPAFIVNCLFLLKDFALQGRKKRAFFVSLILLLLLSGKMILGYTFDVERKEFVKVSEKLSREIEEYAISNPDNIYIHSTGVYNNINPWSVYTDVRPTNLVVWGGSAYKSDNYNKRLELNGIHNLTGEVFKQKNVFLLVADNVFLNAPYIDSSSITYVLFQYLKEKFDAKGFVLEDQINENGYVYHFVFEENESLFDEYYTIPDNEMEIQQIQTDRK